MIIGDYDLTVDRILTPRNENFIRTDGTGNVITTIKAGESFTFPVGQSGYSPLTITNRSCADDIFKVRARK